MNPARRLRISTASGSTYVFDRDAMTWTRLNINVGHEDIRGWEGIKSGTLDSFPTTEVGEPMRFYTEGLWVQTTIVTRVEDIT